MAAPTKEEITAFLIQARLAQAAENPEEDEIDSLEGVELIMAAEEEFDVAIFDAELPLVSRSITRIATLVAARASAQVEGH